MKNPNYSDVSVLMGRVYYWNNQPDSARNTLKALNDRKPYEDAYIALCDIERWEGNYELSLEYSIKGLVDFPKSEDLIIRKARALYKLKLKDDAIKALDSLLRVNKNNDEARKLEESIKNPVDTTYIKARKLALAGKYDSAKVICNKVLEESPDYSDFRVLLARIYYWNKQVDSARYELKLIIDKRAFEDAFVAISDMERWQGNDTASLKYANTRLDSFPTSEDLLIRKARALDNLDSSKEAYHLLDSLLKVDKNNDEARQLAESIHRTLANNSFQIAYYFDDFNREFGGTQWHLISLQYEHTFKDFGSVLWRINWANRFSDRGLQYEMDAYPSISKKMYMYLNVGYSPDEPVFSKYRFGASLYRSFPKNFEGELGFRWLYFTSPTVLYVASIGKYYKNFWFSLRGTFIFNTFGSGFSQSYSFITRYYGKTPADYWTFTIGYGRSPDDLSTLDLLNNPPTTSYHASIGKQISYKQLNIFFGTVGITNEGFYYGNSSTLHNGNDYYFNIGYQRLF
jgi:YaiO family outer membrane protein